MKLLGTICTMSLFLLLGITTPADARQEQQEKQDQPVKPPKQEPQAKPEKRQEQAKGQQERQQREQQDSSAKQEQQQQAKKQQDHQQQQHQQQDKSAKQEQQQAKEQRDQQRQQRQQQDKSVKQEQQRTQQLNRPQQVSMPSRQGQHGQEADQRGAWQERRAHNWQSEHHDWQQRGGYIGYRIPDDRFRGHFGRDHEFRVYSLPVLVVGGYPRFQYGGYWFSLIDPWPEYWSDDWYDSDDVYVDYSEDGYYLYNRRHQGDRIAISVYVD